MQKIKKLLLSIEKLDEKDKKIFLTFLNEDILSKNTTLADHLNRISFVYTSRYENYGYDKQKKYMPTSDQITRKYDINKF